MVQSLLFTHLPSTRISNILCLLDSILSFLMVSINVKFLLLLLIHLNTVLPFFQTSFRNPYFLSLPTILYNLFTLTYFRVCRSNHRSYSFLVEKKTLVSLSHYLTTHKRLRVPPQSLKLIMCNKRFSIQKS